MKPQTHPDRAIYRVLGRWTALGLAAGILAACDRAPPVGRAVPGEPAGAAPAEPPRAAPPPAAQRRVMASTIPGRWYPDDAAALGAQMRRLLDAAAAGSLLAGLLLLPLLGNRATLPALALLLLANLPVPALRRAPAGAAAAAPPSPVVWLRRLGYFLAGAGLTVLIGYRHWAAPLPAEPAAPPADAITIAVPAPVPPPVPMSDREDPAAADGRAADDTPDDGASRLRGLIREGRLSDHEADFYRPVTD